MKIAFFNMSVLDDIVKGMSTNLLNSSKGLKKENIYRKDVFANCLTRTDKNHERAKIRNVRDSFMKSILTCKDEKTLKAIVNDFMNYYKAIYLVNDFSLASIASNNTDAITKQNLEKMLQTVKKVVENKPKKTTRKKATDKKDENGSAKNSIKE